MTAAAPVRAPEGGLVTIAVTSGKGGVGKTNVVVNLAVTLARQRHRVAVLDGDFGLGNVDVLLGLAPAAHLGHVLSGQRELVDIMVDGPEGIRLIPASSGLRELTALTPAQWDRLSSGLDAIASQLDFLVIDTASGIAGNVIGLLLATDRVLVVTSPEPTAIVDAYALVKVLSMSDPAKDIGVLVNGARNADEAGTVFRQLEAAVQRFLGRRLRSYGFIAQDPAVRQAVSRQQPVVCDHPKSPASLCFRVLAAQVAALRPLGGTGLRHRPALPAVRTGVEAPTCA
ncbi:MAG TPA: MinD/ParA family protein [Vicinamibacterales bacterium]